MTDADDRSERIPADLDAEGVVLSALLMGSLDAPLDRVLRVGLRAGHFYADANRHVFEACLQLGGNSIPIDAVSVAGWLRHADLLRVIGGAPYLALLADTQPATAHPEVHALTIIELWKRREFLRITTQLQIQMRHGELDSTGAYMALRDFYKEMRNG